MPAGGGGSFGKMYRASHQRLGSVIYKKLRAVGFVGISDRSVQCVYYVLQVDSGAEWQNIVSTDDYDKTT